MKKTKLLLTFLLLGLAHAGLSRAAQTKNAPSVSGVSKSVKPGTLTFGPFKGWGVTDDLAQQEALGRALRFLEDYAERLNPPRSWILTPAQIRRQFVKSLEVHPEQDRKVQGELVKCWSLTIEITPAQFAELNREGRTRERMSLLAKVVLLVVLSAAAVAGYLRFEEWAHWRSTFVPRLAGVSLLAAVSAAAWWLW